MLFFYIVCLKQIHEFFQLTFFILGRKAFSNMIYSRLQNKQRWISFNCCYTCTDFLNESSYVAYLYGVKVGRQPIFSATPTMIADYIIAA